MAVNEALESRRLFAAIIWSENFDNLAFGPQVEETYQDPVNPEVNVWTKTPPAGWVRDDTGVPGYNLPNDNNGVAEWIGWTFPKKNWWAAAAGDQERTKFTKASGGVMVADDDEWDDQPHPGKGEWRADQLYTAKMTTGNIPISGVVAGTTMLEFDSAWRPEARDDGAAVNNQTGIIEAVYPDGTSVEVLHWDSVEGSPFYKSDASAHWNEHVAVPLPIPAGVTSVKLRFTLGEAANDWWWAVDNLAVTGALDVPGVRLIGVTGNTGGPAADTESLFNVTYTTGATPSVTTAKFFKLPGIPDGDAIGFNPVSGLLHHTSGGSSTSETPADPNYRDNHFMETINVVAGTNAQATVFNANAQQFGPAGPRPTFVLPSTRRTDTQTDSETTSAAGPGEYFNARDMVWSAADNAFFVADRTGIYKVTATGTSTFVGDPAIGGEGPTSIALFNVQGQRRLLVTTADALYTLNPATAEQIGAVNLTDATGLPIPGVYGLVESPDTTMLLGIAKDQAAPDDPLRRNLVQVDPLTGIVTPIGRINAALSDLAFVFSAAAPQPTVSEVYVRGSTWLGQDNNAATTTFMEYLEAKGLGDDVMGYRLFGTGRTAPASNPEDILPWINADQVVVRYSSAPTGSGIPTPTTLTMSGLRNGAYTVSAVNPVPGDPTAFVLTLGKPLGGGNPAAGTAPTTTENGDRVTLGVPGGGAAGSNFSFAMKVLQGDTDHLNETTHNVLARDFAEVKKKFFKNTTSAVAGTDADYSVFHDVDANGQILARDFAEVKKRFFQNLPAAPVAAAASLGGTGITEDLFGTTAVL